MLVTRLAQADAPSIDALARLGDVGVDVANETAKPWARLWVARAAPDGDPCGFLLAWAVADELHVIDVFVRPDVRRRGAGRAMLDALVNAARDERARLILLEVRRSNTAALRLYRSQGFRAIGIRRGYYARDSEDAIEMILALDPETGRIQPGHDEVRLPELRD